ncbi:MAG: pantoate kinase [Candidatus Thorarchaeota archaeon]
MTIGEKTAHAFVPGHITGLFRIHDEHENPLYRGSTGAGFSVSMGTKTSVTIAEHSTLETEIKYNEQKIDGPITHTVVKRLSEIYEMPFKAKVIHQSSLPIGVGFGASGAGALGTALAICNIIDSDLTNEEVAQHAHYSEVINHAGLGDVIAQTVGGLEIRTHPGAPGIGKVMNVNYPQSLHVVLAGATGLDTKDVLTDPTSRVEINNAGGSLVSELIGDPTLDHFIECSREFANITGLMTDRVTTSLKSLDDFGFDKSSMVMLGDSVFCFCEVDSVHNVTSILSQFWDESEILCTTISKVGGGLIE